uniref:Ubiquitin-like protease family profile domain-containing protein n=1 Tax=Panagrolaimus sp. ES5 TaxID=591445 RepID=A0AC34F146_9BILA
MDDSDDNSQGEEKRNEEVSELFYTTLTKPSRGLALLPFHYPRYFGEEFESYRLKYCGSKIKAYDFDTLEPKTWLNDTIVNSYMDLIVERSQLDHYLPKVYSFHSFFYPNYRKKEYDGIASWIKHDIFDYDYILIPIHELQNAHWLMIIVDVELKVIGAFDSLSHDNTHHLEHVRKFLVTHAKAVDDITNELADWEIFNDKSAPPQQNGYDCGVYASQYAQYICKRKILDFQQSQLNYFRKRMKYELLKAKLLND